MSRTLFLVRHAQSADKQSGQTDHDRELTSAGRQQATALGLFFQEQKYFFDAVMCSTAIRTKQTLVHILSAAPNVHANRLFFEEEYYQGTAQDYYNSVINFDDQFPAVLIIGHNPSITALASHLLEKQPAESFSPASFAEISFDVRTWRDLQEYSGKLITFRNPVN